MQTLDRTCEVLVQLIHGPLPSPPPLPHPPTAWDFYYSSLQPEVTHTDSGRTLGPRAEV